jgi:hypothetical protein
MMVYEYIEGMINDVRSMVVVDNGELLYIKKYQL